MEHTPSSNKTKSHKGNLARAADLAADINSPKQRERRKIARDTARAYFAVCRAAGLEPDEARTAFAISCLCYDTKGKDADTPRKLTLAAIGAQLTSLADDKKDKDARWKRAQRHVSHLFCHGLPRVGLQLLGRLKSVEDGKAHEYADYAMAVAGVVAELFDAEREVILASDAKGKAAAIDDAMARLAREALVLFQPLDAAIVGPDRKLFAVVTAPQAKAFCKKNPTFKASAYTYTPPATPDKDKPPRPFYDEDKQRLKERIKTDAEKHFDDLMERNSFDEARLFVQEVKADFDDMCIAWVKTAAARAGVAARERGELRQVSQNGWVEEDDASEPEPETNLDTCPTYDILSWVPPDNPNEDNDIIFSGVESASTEAEPEPPPILEPSVNFDDPAASADFYIRDGWAVVPCCQFDPETRLCTGPNSHQKDPAKPCRGKRPLIKGKKPTPGAGYTAASRDRGLARDWFTRQFPDAGVALRLDGHILIDCDVKDGARGLESYQVLADTFGLDETLSAVTPSGGRHYIFKLPEGLAADFLGSWTRVADEAGFDGIDIKVDVRGLAHVEPSRGAKGVYRWIDPAADIATLPREFCDYLREVHDRATPPAPESAQTSESSEAQPFDPDQAKYFKDVPAGKRRPRLLRIARKIRAIGGTAAQIATALRYHADRFSEPLDEPTWIERTARECELKFAPEVTV